MSKRLLLWLEGTLQSWGNDSRFNRRSTSLFPTKSGIIGIIFCAAGLGGTQTELLSRLSDMDVEVGSFAWKREGVEKEAETMILEDFHMFGSGYKNLFKDGRNNKWAENFLPRRNDGKKPVSNGGGTGKITRRQYLVGSMFSVIIEIPDDLEDIFVKGLANPVWPICLGRKTCIPSRKVLIGSYETKQDAENALLGYLKSIEEERNEGHIGKEPSDTFRPNKRFCLEKIFSVVEGTVEPSLSDDRYSDCMIETFIMNDVPVCFGKYKRYKERFVSKISPLPY